MQLEDYFEIQGPDDIRIRGSRIGIESVLYEHIHRSRSPVEIAEQFPALSLEQIFATILYYLHDEEKFDAYLTRWLQDGVERREEQRRNPPPIVERLRDLKAEENAA